MEKNQEKFKKNFLQSNEWRKFQEAVGHKTFDVSDENFSASIVEHELPIVGKYFYVPKGPIFNFQFSNSNKKMTKGVQELINLAKEKKAGWIRIDPESEEILRLIKENLKNTIVKAPHYMQPKETLIMDISKSEEEILAGMKSKTRYNIKLAEKKEVRIKKQEVSEEYIEEFLRLTKIMSERQGIVTHEENYYQKMFEIIPENIIKLYVAEYDNPASTREDDRSSTRGGKIIATNIVIFYGDTAYYLHGASDDKYKNLMAPHLLQWKQIQDAREVGCVKYDFCGVKVNNKKGKSWEGVTRFKLGFSPNTKPIEFPGCYDIIVSPVRYRLYRILQFIKSFIN